MPISAAVIGSFVQDHCWRTTDFPAPGESRIGSFATFPGGKGFNQAIAAVRQIAQPEDLLFIGALGRDALAEPARAFAQANNLHCVWVEKTASTGAASIVVDAHGANLICVALGANELLSAADIEANTEHLQHARVIAAQLEVGLSASQAALAIARKHGALSILNPAPMNSAVDAQLLALADVLTPNETEFAFLLQHLHGIAVETNDFASDESLHALCRRLSAHSVVLTLGAAGVFVSHAADAWRGDTHAYYREPAATVRVVDTTGAGDAFTGGLLAAHLRFADAPFQRKVRHATRVAGLSVETAGTAQSMPSFAAVQARFGTLSA
jgi:ribokinase